MTENIASQVNELQGVEKLDALPDLSAVLSAFIPRKTSKKHSLV